MRASTLLSNKTFINARALFIANSLLSFANFLLSVVLARKLSLEQYGEFYLFITIALMSNQLIELGINLNLQKVTSRQKIIREIVVSSIYTKLFLIFLISTIVFIVLPYLYEENLNNDVLLILLFSQLVESISLSYSAIYYGKERMKYPAFSNVLKSISILLISFFVYMYTLDIILVAVLLLISNMTRLYALIKPIGFKYRPNNFSLSLGGNIIKRNWAYGMTALFSMINLKIDTVMLSLFKDLSQVGLYTATSNIIVGFGLISSSYLQSAMPSLSRLAIHDHMQFRKRYYNVLLHMTALACFIAIFGIFSSHYILTILYNENIANHYQLLQIMFVALIMMFLVGTSGVALNSQDLPYYSLVYSLLMAVINVLLNLYFIPELGAIGAAIATVISFALGFMILHIIILYKTK